MAPQSHGSAPNAVRLVTIHTDGSCLGNPGPGGYAAVLEYRGQEREISGGFRRTTNNRMETLAVIAGLEALTEPCSVTVYSDSRYVVDAIEKGWAVKWKANGWMRNKRERAVNPDLWDRLLTALDKHRVELKWVRGHAGNTGNTRADRLAVAAANGQNLPRDEAYENPGKEPL
ncbi:Ribonuclease H [Geodia barretti]|uniref:ribonuclease H n=2 Tax=Geodia barretti TaxID=519541 RepID=A0AA35QUM7_GEOBA|nr:Ribonuclease H [Geodia barretti]